MPAVLCAMHDPGGALALAPVLRLVPPGWADVFAGEWARDMLRRQGVAARPLHKDVSPQEAEALLDGCAAQALLTATSWGGDAEQALRNAARRRRLPSVTVLDFWSNYRMRFRHADVPIESMPDLICVMDEGTRQEMIGEGFAASRLVVTGQPHLEALFADGCAPACGPTDRLLFLSQPDLANGLTVHGDSLMRRIFQEAGRMASARGRRMHLFFKPHPKETPPAPERLRVLCDPDLVEVTLLSRTMPLLAALDGVEAAVGGPTMGLFEARARGVGATALCAVNATPALVAALRQAGIRVQQPPACPGIFEHETNAPPAKWRPGAARRILDAVTRSMG
ncbi:MAG: hypothetical protein RDU30_08860 [Desulfovibrionaceae bacterium]|nr:hypothetical protein [Desulfovibrionaceae bacterium]